MSAEPPVAVVTGAGGGLGEALARLYAARGWRVIPICRSDGDARRLADELGSPAIARDLADFAAPGIGGEVGRIAERVDVLVNAAGIGGRAATADALDPRELRALFDVHCAAAARCVRELLPLLRAARPGKVVNVTSRVGSFARNARGDFDSQGISYAYRIAKAAQNMLTLALGRELAADEVIVAGVHPGEFRSGINDDATEDSAAAAARLAAWIDALGPAHHGLCHDAGGGVIPW